MYCNPVATLHTDLDSKVMLLCLLFFGKMWNFINQHMRSETELKLWERIKFWNEKPIEAQTFTLASTLF